MKRLKQNSRRKLTQKEKAFLKGVQKGLSLTDAALQAGYSEKFPGTSGGRAMRQIEKKAPDLGDLFARHGLDDDSFVQNCLIPALNATEVKAQYVHGDGKKQKAGFVYSAPMIAWTPRTTTNALVARMKGLIKEEAPPAPGGIKVVIVNANNRPEPRNVKVIDATDTNA